MPRFLVALTVTLTILIFALALTARAWGETQPPHPALRGFVEGCEGIPQPCWYGIVPGETWLDDTIQVLIELGYTPGGNSGSIDTYIFHSNWRQPGSVLVFARCTSVDCNDPTYNLYLYDWSNLPLGEALSQFGPPPLFYYSGLNDELLSYPDAHIEVTPLEDLSNAFQSVEAIRVGRSQYLNPPQSIPWRGFLPIHKYCPLPPIFQCL